MKIFSERGISLLARTIMEALVGVNYAYSVFQQPLMQKYGWSIQETSFGYTFYFIMVLLSSLYLCNKTKNGMRIQKVVRLGAVFYSAGVLLIFFVKVRQQNHFIFRDLNSIWACYLHACIKQVQGKYLTNSSLRKRFGLEVSSSGSISRLIKEAVELNYIKPLDPNTAPRYMKYILIWT